MQVVKNEAYSNFVDSINSDQTRQVYQYTLSQFLKHYDMNLNSFLKLSQQEISNFIIDYLVNKKISRQYKIVIFSSLKHACEMNDVILNWKKLKKFIKSDKTENSINGKDRGYTDKEIRKILEFSDQRLKTAFLVLASTGIRIGALQLIKIGDLERIDSLYKIIIYRGDTEEYFTFCTPECASEIDSYLDYRKRRGETITDESYLLVRKFSQVTQVKGKPFKGKALGAILQDGIDNSGLREIDHENPYKRKQIPIFHGFRKFYTKQVVDSKLNPLFDINNWTKAINQAGSSLALAGKEVLNFIVAGAKKAPEVLNSLFTWIGDQIKNILPTIWDNIFGGGGKDKDKSTLFVSMPEGDGGAFPWANKPGGGGSWNFPIAFNDKKKGQGDADPFGMAMAKMIIKAAETKQKIQQIFLEMSGALSNIWLGMATNFSAMMNSFGPNAKSAGDPVRAELFKAFSVVVSNIRKLAHNWSVAMNSMIANAKSAANGVISALNKIPREIVTVHRIVTQRGEGGVMSFARGGVMSAAMGTMFTANGRQNITVGDNPGGRETVAFIPHNDPGPTLEKLRQMFGGFMSSGYRMSSGSSRSGGNIIIHNHNYLDGIELQNKLSRLVHKNEAGYR